jgi:putative transposase
MSKKSHDVGELFVYILFAHCNDPVKICSGDKDGEITDEQRNERRRQTIDIYTANAVEFLNSVIRAATKRRKVFPTDDSARKVVYLAIEQASRKWTMPIQNWKMALNRFVLEFGERVTVHHP